MEDIQKLRELVNPVFNTAKMTLFQLMAAGNADAKMISDRLGLTFEETQGSSATAASRDEMEMDSVIMEIRYRTMGLLAEGSGCPTEVDLPCGYTPRAIEFARKGRRFVGLDLPAAIAEAEPAIMPLIDEENRHLVSFAGVDATNYQSLKEIFDRIEGEVSITTEGLLMYFTSSETGVLCDNIRKILSEHGGCWITPDPEMALLYIQTVRAFYGERFMEVMNTAKKRTSEKADVNVGSNPLMIKPYGDVAENMKAAMTFLARHGLRAERLVAAEYAPEIKTLEQLEPGRAEAVKEALKKAAFWRITPIAAEQLNASDTEGENFRAEASMAEETLFLKLFGRLDTLSAPNLLDFFEKAAKEHVIRQAEVDCSALEYISSAGLRVMLIMRKSCENGVTLRNTNKVVGEILEQTGFDAILKVES